MAAPPAAPAAVARAAATRVLVGIVYDDSTSTPLLQLDFATVGGVTPDSDFKTLVLRKIRPLPEFAHVTLTGQMFIYGPWRTQPARHGNDVSALLQAGEPLGILDVLADLPELALPGRAAAGQHFFFVVRVPPPGASPLPAARACAGGRACAECGLGLG